MWMVDSMLEHSGKESTRGQVPVWLKGDETSLKLLMNNIDEEVEGFLS